MNTKFPIRTKIAGLVVTTILLIILALCLYLFVVIKNNEREIVNRSFRTLVQIGENIKSKNTTYIKNIANNTRIYQDTTIKKPKNTAICLKWDHEITVSHYMRS